MPAIAVIPARYASTRFPGKVLCLLKGKPLIQHVYERVIAAASLRDVFVATDDERVRDAVASFGGRAVLTSPAHPSGTDRIAEAVRILNAEGCEIGSRDIIVNVQGDEPLIRPEMIDGLVQLMMDGRAAIGTLARRITRAEEVFDPNVVKVVFTTEHFALYFSRSPIPYHRDFFRGVAGRPETLDMPAITIFKHIGVYAYTKEGLERFTALEQAPLEEAERLEQLRALENGIMIRVAETPFDTIGVDIPEDMERVAECLNISS